MKEITYEDYKNFIKSNQFVIIEDVKIKLNGVWNIKSYAPDKYINEKTTVWSFPNRGVWATHKGNYRGNWSPYIPRNLILKYTREGDYVLDQMVGSGTTLIEAKLLNRNAIGVDINLDAIMITLDRLNFANDIFSLKNEKKVVIKTYVGDARNLNEIKDESIDLIATHPPYANIVSYTKTKKQSDDLSQLSLTEYLGEMRKVAEESFRVLKAGKNCAILIGDTRKHKHYVPLSFMVMQIFLEAGFILKEDIIKIQWNMKTTREKWNKKENDFYLIAHEHLFIFTKPLNNNELKKYKFSVKWW